MKKSIAITLLVSAFLVIFCASFVQGQAVTSIFVEIRTGDETFAGTDDTTKLFIAGRQVNLNDPDRDDFERNNTDVFEISIDDPEFDIETIKAAGSIGIIKTGDSYFGGGWLFGGIKIWLNSQNSAPIYENNSINDWLDGDIEERSWRTNFGDVGWNLPEPAPFPPCKTTIIFFSPAATPDDSGGQLDSDCDGTPDDLDTTFDPNQPDRDGDGLPDRYEEQNGSKANSNDSDDDHWLDHKNIKDVLMLTKIECLDETTWTNVGTDETYLVSEDVRFPLSQELTDYWQMDAGTSIEPFLIIDTRVPGDSVASPQYKTRLNLREADMAIFEKSTDNNIFRETLEWGRNETKVINYSNGAHYKLHFKSFTTYFLDPSLTDDNGDVDKDGLSDDLEFKISTQADEVRVTTNPIDGYNGMASPLRRQLFIEVDAVYSPRIVQTFPTTLYAYDSEDARLPEDGKVLVASQFYYHNISTRIDDGYLGGGGDMLPYEEGVTLQEVRSRYQPQNQDPKRESHYRYALFVPNINGVKNGHADQPGTRLIVSRSTMVASFSAIVFMHELGHNLSLCHPLNTTEPPSPSPTCPTPTDWDGCRHYCGVGDHDVTAMGSDPGTQTIVIGGAIGIMVGLVIIALFIPGIGWAWGAALLTAAALLGAIGGFLFSDAYQRLVDYHANEWAVIMLNALF